MATAMLKILDGFFLIRVLMYRHLKSVALRIILDFKEPGNDLVFVTPRKGAHATTLCSVRLKINKYQVKTIQNLASNTKI